LLEEEVDATVPDCSIEEKGDEACAMGKISSAAIIGFNATGAIGKVGEDVEVVRKVPPSAEIPPIKKNPLSTVKIMYSYEGPEDSRNRPFCAQMMQLNSFYSRKDIETISERLGYSVFDRRGGFWMHKDGTVTPYCRHRWQSNIVVKK
jgi:hypothetical protein